MCRIFPLNKKVLQKLHVTCFHIWCATFLRENYQNMVPVTVKHEVTGVSIPQSKKVSNLKQKHQIKYEKESQQSKFKNLSETLIPCSWQLNFLCNLFDDQAKLQMFYFSATEPRIQPKQTQEGLTHGWTVENRRILLGDVQNLPLLSHFLLYSVVHAQMLQL